MIVEPKIALRLKFLTRVVRKECRHLATTDQRLFGSGFNLAHVNQLESDPAVLASALQSGHAFVSVLIAAADGILAEIESRGLA